MHKPQDGRLEVKNIDFLKEGLAKHDAISIHLAAITQGAGFFILYEFADFGSLEDFLKQEEPLKVRSLIEQACSHTLTFCRYFRSIHNSPCSTR